MRTLHLLMPLPKGFNVNIALKSNFQKNLNSPLLRYTSLIKILRFSEIIFLFYSTSILRLVKTA